MRSLVLALLLMSVPALANPLFTDPPATATPRARMEVLHIPSGGVEINGVAYLAAGPGPRGAVVSSISVFQSPQASQRPCHLGLTAPQAWQTKRLRSLAIQARARIR